MCLSKLDLHRIYYSGEKVFICELAEVLSPQITVKLVLQIANPQSVTFADGPQIYQII